MLKPTGGKPGWENYAPGEGAYYYVYGGAVSTVKKISGIIILPTKVDLKGTGGGRNAYISFGLSSTTGGIDIGIQNLGQGNYGAAGQGWQATCFEVWADSKTLHGGKAPAGAKRVRIEVEPNLITKKSIAFKVEWLDGNNSVIDAGKNFSGNIPLKQTYNWNEFYRFASLVTTDPNSTRTDSTYMLGGEFMDVKAGSSNWGIGTGAVRAAWIINHPKCQLPDGYWDTGEQFRIDHWA